MTISKKLMSKTYKKYKFNPNCRIDFKEIKNLITGVLEQELSIIAYEHCRLFLSNAEENFAAALDIFAKKQLLPKIEYGFTEEHLTQEKLKLLFKEFDEALFVLDRAKYTP